MSMADEAQMLEPLEHRVNLIGIVKNIFRENVLIYRPAR